MSSPREQAVEIAESCIREILGEPDALDEWVREVAAGVVHALLAARVPCTTCAGTGTVDGWPLPGQGDAITRPMTAADPMPPIMRHCPNCTDGYGGPLILLGPRRVGQYRTNNGGAAWIPIEIESTLQRGFVPAYVVRPENEKA